MKTPICLVTGASAGIGAAIAREYAARGWHLALVARREEPMVELALDLKREFDTVSHIFPCDLFAPDATENLMARIKKKGIHISGLVNNAGYGHPGTFLDSPWEDHDKFIQLMLSVPCELTRALLPDMKEAGFGRIINVASLAGLIPGSREHTLYGAVKSFLIKFSQSLNLEMKGTGVHVSALCPGFTYSEFHDVNGTRESVSKLPDWAWMSAKDTAVAGVIACERNDAVYVPGRANKCAALLAKLIPEKLGLYIMNKNSERVRKG